MFDDFINFVRKIYDTEDIIPLHKPQFSGNEVEYLIDTIKSTYVKLILKVLE